VGRHVSQVIIAQRLGRSILELGGNNGIIVMDDAQSRPGAARLLFGAVGRRAALHHHAPPLLNAASRPDPRSAGSRLRAGAYRHPLDERTIMGPLINRRAVEDMLEGLPRVARTGERFCSAGERWRAATLQRRWCAPMPACRF